QFLRETTEPLNRQLPTSPEFWLSSRFPDRILLLSARRTTPTTEGGNGPHSVWDTGSGVAGKKNRRAVDVQSHRSVGSSGGSGSDGPAPVRGPRRSVPPFRLSGRSAHGRGGREGDGRGSEVLYRAHPGRGFDPVWGDGDHHPEAGRAGHRQGPDPQRSR